MPSPKGIIVRLFAAVFLAAMPAFPIAANAEAAANKELVPNDTCLGCHDDKELTKDLPDGKNEVALRG
jgi:hypothetical protein